MSDATVKIPAEHADAFYREAVDTISLAASSLEEAAEWFMKGKGDPNRLERDEIPRTVAAISLVERARNGELEFGAEDAVRATLEGLVLKAAERVRDEAEGSSATATRQAMAELDTWMTLLDSKPMEKVRREREARYAERQRDREAVAR